jgi:hypothetical protein
MRDAKLTTHPVRNVLDRRTALDLDGHLRDLEGDGDGSRTYYKMDNRSVWRSAGLTEVRRDSAGRSRSQTTPLLVRGIMGISSISRLIVGR